MADLILPSLWETLYMVFFSTIFSLILGFPPLGILLVITEKDGIWEKNYFKQYIKWNNKHI